MTRIAFIGLGAMGGPMAANLASSGHDVRGFDPSEEAAARAAAQGVVTCTSAHEALAATEAVVTMLPRGQEVAAAVLEGDVLASLPQGTLLVDSSSIDVATSLRLHEAAATHGLPCLDAPVSGGIAGATAGSLTFMVGGETTHLDQARPLLEAMGSTVVHVGPAGSGQAAKACNQMLFGTTLAAVGEMFVLADSLGLDRRVLWEIVTASTGDCRAIRSFCPVPGVVDGSPADRDFAPGFAAPLMVKDLGLALGAADRAGATLPLARTAADAYARLVRDHGALDSSAVIKTVTSTDAPLSNPTQQEEIR